MNRRTILANILVFSAAVTATAAHADDKLPPGAYVLSYDDQVFAVELVAQGEARSFTIEIEDVPTPLIVTFHFDGKGGLSANDPFSGGVWKWTGTSDGIKASGNTTFTYQGASASTAFELVPRAKVKPGRYPAGRRGRPPKMRA